MQPIRSRSAALACAARRIFFASVRQSVHNRWPWLALNLVTAFVASRVISHFEETIASVVALAALMPIVASMGGNTGNQTVALVIRALARISCATSTPSSCAKSSQSAS